MTILNILRPGAIAAAVICNATSAAAQDAPETLDEVVAVMQACLVMTAAHDYDAEGQGMVVPWLRIGSFSAGLGDQKSAVLVGAQVRGSGASGNSYCDFVFQDAALGQEAFDIVMADRATFDFEEYQGFCVNDAFIATHFIADGAYTDVLTEGGTLSIYNPPKFNGDPCAS